MMMTVTWTRRTLIGLALLTGSLATPAMGEDHKIPLKLLGEEDIDGGIDKCRLAFWQSNKSPETDRYAYLLYAKQETGGFTDTAQIQIGTKYRFLTELVYGGEPIEGFGTQYLFATDDRDVRVHVELMDVNYRNNAHFFDKAKVTVIQKGKIPFTANAKGVSGCPGTDTNAAASAASDAQRSVHLPSGIPIGQERLLNGTSEVPAVLRQQMRDYAYEACDIDGYFAWGGASYVINENYLLWQIPCFSGAYQGSGVFAVTQNPPQGWGELLTLPNPPGLEGNQNYAAMNAQVSGPNGHITTTDLARGAGDCGVYQTFRLTDGPGEVLELELLEYREKIDCDGVAVEPENWPLAYSAN